MPVPDLHGPVVGAGDLHLDVQRRRGAQPDRDRRVGVDQLGEVTAGPAAVAGGRWSAEPGGDQEELADRPPSAAVPDAGRWRWRRGGPRQSLAAASVPGGGVAGERDLALVRVVDDRLGVAVRVAVGRLHGSCARRRAGARSSGTQRRT